MKRILCMLLLVSVFIPFTHIFGIGGFGIQGGQSLLSIESSQSTEGEAILIHQNFQTLYPGVRIFILMQFHLLIWKQIFLCPLKNIHLTSQILLMTEAHMILVGQTFLFI